jgi:hypothetical protein
MWGLVGLLYAGSIIAFVLLFGEIAEIRRDVSILAGMQPGTSDSGPAPALPEPGAAGEAPLPTTAPNIGDVDTWGSSLSVRVTHLAAVSDTAWITATVRGSGSADPLLNLPVLVCGDKSYPVDGASLEAARTDLLDLITRGEAQMGLLFYGGPDLTQSCVLILNPEESATSIVAPRIEVPVPRMAPAPTAAPVSEE